MANLQSTLQETQGFPSVPSASPGSGFNFDSSIDPANPGLAFTRAVIVDPQVAAAGAITSSQIIALSALTPAAGASAPSVDVDCALIGNTALLQQIGVTLTATVSMEGFGSAPEGDFSSTVDFAPIAAGTAPGAKLVFPKLSIPIPAALPQPAGAAAAPLTKGVYQVHVVLTLVDKLGNTLPLIGMIDLGVIQLF